MDHEEIIALRKELLSATLDEDNRHRALMRRVYHALGDLLITRGILRGTGLNVDEAVESVRRRSNQGQ